MEVQEGGKEGKTVIWMQCIREEYVYKNPHAMMRKEGQAPFLPVVPLEKYFFFKKD